MFRKVSMSSTVQLAAPPTSARTVPLVSVRDVHRSYGNTRALAGVTITVHVGEVLGVVGHNGAGKSTLMRIISGTEEPDRGAVQVDGLPAGSPWTAAAAEARGVRMVHQELALLPDLTVAENAHLSDRRRPGRQWRASAERRILDALDDVFPGHSIDVVRRTGDLPMAQRQMVEIARAVCTDGLRLLILDEPTESLGADAAAQLYEFLRRRSAQGMSALLISHRMNEVLAHSDRIAVLRDGAVVGVHEAADTSEERLLSAMGGEVARTRATRDATPTSLAAAGAAAATVARLSIAGSELVCHAGEIVGLAGLAGQGQDEVLRRMWTPGLLSRGSTVPSRRAYVPGDRQVSGILPLWTVAENLTISAGRTIARGGLVSPARKRRLAADWVDRLRIRGGAAASITALSGGNQQKVLVARAFAADATLVLLDDPFRGVDVHTKNELYTLMREEAARGRGVVWYSTENKEMAHCDRVYVFRAGRIVSELRGPEITEERIIADSFDDVSGEERR